VDLHLTLGQYWKKNVAIGVARQDPTIEGKINAYQQFCKDKVALLFKFAVYSNELILIILLFLLTGKELEKHLVPVQNDLSLIQLLYFVERFSQNQVECA